MVAYKYFGSRRLVNRWLELSTLVVDVHDWKLVIRLSGEGEGQYIDGPTRGEMELLHTIVPLYHPI